MVVFMIDQAEEATLALVLQYLAIVADPAARWDDLAPLLHPEMVQDELPNALFPQGVRRDLAALQASHARGAEVMRDQRYEILRTLVDGDRVAVELDWRGTLRVAAGRIAAGTVLHARIAAFIEVRAGRIVAQRNYDCYDPF